MVGSVVTFLLENVNQLLTDEAKLLGGVKDQVRSLQNELSMINRDLQNREGKRDAEGKATLKEVAYEAEDVIDTFIIKAKVRPLLLERFSTTIKSKNISMCLGGFMYLKNTKPEICCLNF